MTKKGNEGQQFSRKGVAWPRASAAPFGIAWDAITRMGKRSSTGREKEKENEKILEVGFLARQDSNPCIHNLKPSIVTTRIQPCYQNNI